MEKRTQLEMLLRNFRLSEAIGYILALADTDKISTKRGENCANLLRAYNQVVRDGLWNREGLLILSTCKIDEVSFKDIVDERDRLISLIERWMISEKKVILLFVSAYYGVANADGLRMKINMDKIVEEIKDDGIEKDVSMALGGYEKFQAITNALERYYHLDDSIFEMIREFNISIQENC